ncbi:MAG: sensor domain-containing diguanylate cyclase [Thalassotalea sp.]
MLKEQKQFSALLALLLLSGFMVTSWLSYQVAISSLEQHISSDSLPLTGDNIYSEIQQDLFKPIFISSLMAQDTFVRDWKINGEARPEKVVKYLKEIQIKYNTLTSYFISDASHNYYHPNGTLKQVSKNDPKDNWYFAFKQSPAEQQYEINIDQDTANPEIMAVFVNYKVYDYDDNFIGITGVGLALHTVKELIESYQQRYQRTVYFTDKNGKITLHGDLFNQQSQLSQRLKDIDLATDVLNSKENTLSYSNAGNKIYLNSRFIEEFNWYLIVEQDVISSEKKLTQAFIINILLSILVTAGVLLIAHLTFRRYQRNLVTMASIDKLSGLLNRQAFEPIILNNIEQCKRKTKPLALMLLDIDDFKSVNDNYGHLTGDKVIQSVAKACQLNTRDCDAVCRWGGEEFIIMLADTTIEGAKDVAERIQKSLLRDDLEPKVTISFGITEYSENEALDCLLNRADDALYQAKRNGRNRIEVQNSLSE